MKRFEDHLVDDGISKIMNFASFGEYRKGSNEYGTFINDLMMYLRNFRKENEDNLTFKVKGVKFDVNKLHKLKNDENKTRLVSFDIKFTDKHGNEVEKPDYDGFVIFSGLNKKDDRPWENKNEERI